jgi:hypothetical protein
LGLLGLRWSRALFEGGVVKRKTGPFGEKPAFSKRGKKIVSYRIKSRIGSIAKSIGFRPSLWQPADRAQPVVREDPCLRGISLIGLASFFLAQIAYNFVDIDIWHQMALIRGSLSAGHLLRIDPFAYTPTLRPWIDHEWGAGLIAYFTTLWFGERAILTLKFLMAFGAGLVCWRCSAETGCDDRLWATCAPLAIFLAHFGFFAVIRAQAYSFFFAALLMLFCRFDCRGSRAWIAVWLILFPLWVNLHGGFVLGIGLMALHILEEVLHGRDVGYLLAIFTAMLLETLLTPYGTAYLAYLRRALLMSRPFAPEWRPVWDLGPFWVMCFALAVAVVVYSVASAGIHKAPGILQLAATAVEATLHRKLLPLFAVAWLCYAPFYLQRTAMGQWILGFMQHRRRFVLAAWMTLACASMVAAVRQKPWDVFVPQPIYPVGPVNYLAEQGFEGNVMVPFRLGAYVSWKLFPKVKVSLDSRYEETYPNQVVEEVFRFYDARPGWRATLDAYPTDVVLVPRDSPVVVKMPQAEWPRVYRDQQFEMYARPGLSLSQTDWSSRSFTGAFP